MGREPCKGKEHVDAPPTVRKTVCSAHKIVLDMSRVLLFTKSVDVFDKEKVGLLLEMDDGLIDDWTMVKEVCS